MSTDGNRMKSAHTSIMTLKNIGPSTNAAHKFIYESSPLDDEDVRPPAGDWIIKGRILPNSDIYKDGSIQTEIILKPTFPFKPPKVVLKTEVYHPNVTKEGEVCILLLEPKGPWTPTTTLRTVVEEVIKVIDEPSTDGIQHTEAASLWDTDKDAYKQKASDIFSSNRLPRT